MVLPEQQHAGSLVVARILFDDDALKYTRVDITDKNIIGDDFIRSMLGDENFLAANYYKPRIR
jgi:hypothetical protein